MDVIRKTVVLTVVTALAAAILAVTYGNTVKKIDKYLEEEFIALRKSVLPAASVFEKVEVDGIECYIGYCENRKTGFVIPVTVNGYSGKIKMVLGMDMEGKVTGLNVISQTETPGLGSKIEEPWFKAQYRGLGKDDIALKKDSNTGKIDSITEATVSSSAVTKGVKNAFLKYNILSEQAFKKEMVAALPDGFYRGAGKGLAGPIEVEIEIKAGRIKAIHIVKCQEEKQYWSKVKSVIPSSMLEKQSTDVDVVTGATRTSKGLIDAVQDAIDGSLRNE